MITTPAHGLVFGTLDLLGADKTGTYWFEALGEDAEFGNPVPVERVLTSFLQDGAIAEIERDDNREMAFTVVICGTTSAGLAAGELALMAQTRRRNTLTWTPPDNSGDFMGVPCVFDVVTSHLDFKFSDVGELHLERTWRLIIKALPGSRPEAPVSVTSLAPAGSTPTITSIDACTATTNWAAANLNTGGGNLTLSGPTVVSGAVTATVNNIAGATKAASYTLTRSSLSVDMSVAQYLRLDLTTTGSGRATVAVQRVFLNGVETAPTSRNGNVAWYLSPATLTSVQVRNDISINVGGFTTLLIADLSKSTLPTDAVGQRQRFLSLAVAGSARTQGSLLLADPTVGLGSTLVYTTPAGVAQQPPLRVLRVAGSAETTDTSLISGKYSDLATLHAFDIPAANLPPGGYLLYARVKHTSAGTYSLTWSAKSRMGSVTLDTTPQTGTQLATVAAGTWTIVEVAKLVLPTQALGTSGVVRIELTGPSGLLLDEAWPFNYDVGSLTWVEAGSGTGAAGGPSRNLWIDVASLDNPVPSVWLGHTSTRVDAFGAGSALRSWGAHQFAPPEMNVFVVTSNSVATDVTLSSFPRFHTHVVA